MERIWFAVSFVIPSLFFLTNNEAYFSLVMNNSNHIIVFNYLSKPENFPALNPTIYKIEVVREKENEFYVKYEECLSHFSIITNVGFGHYKLTKKEDGGRELTSSHSTCFIGKYFCLPTYSRILINVHGLSRILYKEDIKYTCPWILNTFCFEEILFQRMALMNHLDKLFSEYQPL